jgi:hypothetical protein
MARYRKKPVVIEAVRWFGEYKEPTVWPDWFRSAMADDTLSRSSLGPNLDIKTLEGWVAASPGDYVIRGIKGELYPCRSDIFDATYDAVES